MDPTIEMGVGQSAGGPAAQAAAGRGSSDGLVALVFDQGHLPVALQLADVLQAAGTRTEQGGQTSPVPRVMLAAMGRPAAAAARYALERAGAVDAVLPAGVDPAAAWAALREGTQRRVLWQPELRPGEVTSPVVGAQLGRLCEAMAAEAGACCGVMLLCKFRHVALPDLQAVRDAGALASIHDERAPAMAGTGGTNSGLQKIADTLRTHLGSACAQAAPRGGDTADAGTSASARPAAVADSAAPRQSEVDTLDDLLHRSAGRVALRVGGTGDGATVLEVAGAVGGPLLPGVEAAGFEAVPLERFLEAVPLPLRQPLREMLAEFEAERGADAGRPGGRTQPVVRDRIPVETDAGLQQVVITCHAAPGGAAVLLEPMGLPLPLGGAGGGVEEAALQILRQELQDVRLESERALQRLLREQRELAAGKAEVESLTRRVEAGERLLRRTLDALPIFVVVLAPGGTVLDVNREALARTGLTAELALGSGFETMPWWRHDAAVRREVARAVEQAAGGTPHRSQVTLQPAAPEGGSAPGGAAALPMLPGALESTGGLPALRIIDLRTAPLLDTDGAVTHLLVTGRDITDQLAADNRSAERRLKLDAALSCGRLGMWEWVPATDANVMDPLARELWGYAPEDEVRGETTIGRIHDEDRPRVVEELDRVIAGEAAFDSEFRVVHPDGRVVMLAGRGDALRDFEGNIRGIFGLNWEIEAPAGQRKV